MASNHSQNPSTTTTTSTSTAITIASNRRPLSSSNNYVHPSSSNRSLISRAFDNAPSPRNSNIEPQTPEPFPHLSPDPRIPQIAQVQDLDQIPLSNIPSRQSQTAPVVTRVTTQPRQRPIRIKRLKSHNEQTDNIRYDVNQPSVGLSTVGRRRSTSAPQRPNELDNAPDGFALRPAVTTSNNMPPLVEGQESRSRQYQDTDQQDTSGGISRPLGGSQRMRRVSDAARSAVSRLSNRDDEPAELPADYDDNIVDILDVLDPEVSTLTTLTNVQNSLFVPDLGRWLNRRPTYELTKGPSYRKERPTLNRGSSKPLPKSPALVPPAPPPKDAGLEIPSDIDEELESPLRDHRLSLASVPSIASVVQEEHYAVLPHGMSLEGWSEEDKELLDDHVRHMLHSKREGFKRSMRAFGKYIRKPLGFFVTLYAVLITLFGLAWVLFLIGWIYVGTRQLYIINIIDNVLVALFAIMGDGLAPFRVVDTYHMIFIAHYHHITEKIRKKRNLPKLQDENELPEVHETEVDVEASVKEGDAEFSVLTPEQHKKLVHHQGKFSKSHSYYKPHETSTHHAFPHHLSIAIVILLDLHSCLQITLGGVTWGISYHVRPAALTATVLSCSIAVNITAGILIKVGDNKTRKKDVLTRMFRQELTQEAIRKVEKQKEQDRTYEMREQSDEEDEKHRPDKANVREGAHNVRDSSATIQYEPQVPTKVV